MGVFGALLSKGARVGSVAVLLLSQVSAYAAFMGNQPVSAADQASTPTVAVAPNNWDVSNVTNVQADDFSYATEDDGQEQGYAGFDFSSIPAGSTIDGVTVNTLAARDGSPTNACQLRLAISDDGGATFSTYKTRGLTPDFSYIALGGDSDTWGLALTDTMLTQSLFVVKVDDHDPGTDCDQDTTIFLDQLIATVHYTAPVPEPTYEICHATNSATNPYEPISVNASAIDGSNPGDHYPNHDGPIADTKEEAQQLKDNHETWGDIVPPLPGVHSGQNWTIEGQEILANNCVVPDTDDPMDRPFVRVTFMCKADFDGIALVSGQEIAVNNGDYAFRVRYEASNSEINAPATVPYTVSMIASSGTIAKDQEIIEKTSSSVGGASVTTTPDNLYGGTASTNENQICDQQQVPSATLTVNKYVINDDGGQATADQVAVYVNGNELTKTNLQNPSAGNTISNHETVEVTAGEEFVITEDQLEGYTQDSIGCFVNGQPVGYPVSPLEDDFVVCNVFNYDNPVEVTVTKFVGYENGGDVPATQFPVRLNGELLTPGDLIEFTNGNNATNFDSVEVPVGQEFVITEDAVSGYRLKNIACKVDGQNVGYPYTPSFAERVACSVSNVDLPDPTVTVTKFLRNLDLGTAVASDFTISLNGEELEQGSSQEFSNGNSAVAHTAVSVAPDEEFSITESDVDGYELFFIQCFVDGVSVGYPYTPDYDEEVSCNVINRYTRGSVTVTKDVSNQWGGTLGSSDFTLFIEQLGGQVVASGDGAISIMLAAGDYEISEDQELGYMLAGFGGDCSEVGILSVVAGESASCTVFNEDRPAKIRIHKAVTNDDGGTLDSEDFSFTVNNENQQPFATEGNYVELEVAAGTYTVEEVANSGYAVSYDDCFDIQAEIGQTYNCYVSNDDIAPIVTVSKSAYPCGELEFDFTITHQGELIDFSLADYCQHSIEEIFEAVAVQEDAYPDNSFTTAVLPGVVSVEESPQAGWYQTYASCYNDNSYNNLIFSLDQPTTFTAELGQEYYCEFENYEYSSVKVTKFNDYNQDGVWDDNEPALPDWDMVLTEECDRMIRMRVLDEYSECEPTATTQTTNVSGMTTFEDLRSGSYSLEEVLQDGWTQSVLDCSANEYYEQVTEVRYLRDNVYLEMEGGEDDDSFYIRPGQEVECIVGNYQDPLVDIEKTNSTTGPVLRGTEVTFTLNVSVPPEDESGILQGTMDEGEYVPVTVVDNLTDEFKYVAGSFTASSNVRGDLKAAGITTDPSYASPGKWTLTTAASNQMIQNEVVTLTYRAVVGDTTPAGSYPTLAQVTGYGDDISIVASATDDDEVVVYVPAVLGASTTAVQLASTGDDTRLGLVVGLLLIGAVVFTRRRHVLAKQN